MLEKCQRRKKMIFDLWSNEKSELEVTGWCDFTAWDLGIRFNGYRFDKSKMKSASLYLLCFGICFEYWRWGK